MPIHCTSRIWKPGPARHDMSQNRRQFTPRKGIFTYTRAGLGATSAELYIGFGAFTGLLYLRNYNIQQYVVHEGSCIWKLCKYIPTRRAPAPRALLLLVYSDQLSHSIIYFSYYPLVSRHRYNGQCKCDIHLYLFALPASELQRLNHLMYFIALYKR